MSLDVYEYSRIPLNVLSQKWQETSALIGLEDFLQHNWNLRNALYRDDEIDSRQQYLEFEGLKAIRTKKYIGTIVYKGEQLNIFPRVFSRGKQDDSTLGLNHKHLLKNLMKWVEYCNKLDYPFLNISSELDESQDLKEFFITLYIAYVEDVLSRGIYYQYVEVSENCTGIKGKFDLNDYLVRKVPNGQMDRFACTYSNFISDNLINRIIKCVCRMLFNISSSRNQKKIRQILVKLNSVEDAKCLPADCDKIRIGKMNKKYGIIISMSKMFLLNRTSNYTIDINESFCFLFPVDSLFEGFIGGFVKDCVENAGGKVTLQENKSRLIDRIVYKDNVSGAAFTLRRDILAKYEDKVFILDTKYKELSRFEGNPNFAKSINDEVKSGDLYQVLEYARKESLKDVYLIYPMYRYEEPELDHPIGVNVTGVEEINVHFVRVPFVFEENVGQTEEMIKKAITSIFDLAI